MAGTRSDQGWKLHVSAGLLTARDVLDASLPVIVDEGADFKVAVSQRHLAALNEGLGGSSQVGKFITIYPNDDAQAVRLASALDDATEGLRGPRIASDRALRAGSVVHYRYGGFGGLQIRTRLGEWLPALRAPDGSLVPDRRVAGDDAAPWADDPFRAAGIVEDPPSRGRRLGHRYIILARLHASPRSRIELCMDLTGPARCVVKRAADDGSGSLERLRHEHDVLCRLGSDPRFPRPVELFGHDGELCLAMEDVAGQTMEEHLAAYRGRNALPAQDQIARWAGELASLLAAIHARGLVYGDLKPTNVIVTSDGLRLVDFELTREIGATLPSGGAGTPGYMSPQQSAGRPAAIADDVFGLGALLYLLATGAEPSRAPDPSALLDRPVGQLNPRLGRACAAAIARCLEPHPGRRPDSPALAVTAFAAAARAAPVSPAIEQATREQILALARRIGDALRESVGEDGLEWTRGGLFEGPPQLDLNTGFAGVVLALAELVDEFGDPAHRDALARSAHRLANDSRPKSARLPGLYVGEAGIATALLCAGRVLADGDLIRAAAEIGRSIAFTPHVSPDLFNGSAGRLRLHLWLWLQTSQAEQLEHANAAAAQLLRVARREGDGLNWTIPPGHDALSGQTLTGYAHGAAGIADALLDLFEITGDPKLLDAGRGARAWLQRMARPALATGAGVNWPPGDVGPTPMAFWCHGAAGVARFLFHLGRVGHDPAALELARRATAVVAEATRWSGVTQCHGLAGSVECLLDAYQAGGDHRDLEQARSMAGLLRAFGQERAGGWRLITDRDASSPGFSTGCAGVAVCLLRLAHPRSRPHLLSLHGLRLSSASRHGEGTLR